MPILVIGGAGYIGSSLVPALQKDHDVTVLDPCWFGNPFDSSTKLWTVDALSTNFQHFAGFNQVIYLAGLSSEPMANFSPRKNFLYNTAAPAYVAYIAKQAGVKRFIFASSCSVYGAQKDVCTEESPTLATFPYGVSKLAAEKAIFQLQDKDFSVIALRKGTVSGYSPRMRLDLMVNTMFRDAAKTGKVTVSNPTLKRPILSIGDAVRAYQAAVAAPQAISGAFNITSGNYTLGMLGELTAHHMKAALIIQHKKDYRSYRISCVRANGVLGWVRKDVIMNILNDLSSNAVLFQDFDNPKYYNIEVFKTLGEVTVQP